MPAIHFDARSSSRSAFILLACIFDLFDGRVARMGGEESPFGREFDSLADLISFGVAPGVSGASRRAADVFAANISEIGWFIASIYLICGAFRLARFNCLVRHERAAARARIFSAFRFRRRPAWWRR